MAVFSRAVFAAYIEIPEAHRLDATRPAGRCPRCEGAGRWRSGLGFEHEKICMRHEPSEVWCPGDIQRYREIVAEQQIGQDGFGI